jgi:methylmalonyl-CoA mutase N-terminal domain/subunit
MGQIEEHGGVVAGIEDGSLERAIAESAYEQQRLVESGERVIVGVNRFAEEGAESRDAETFTVGPDVLERQLARLERTRQSRDDALVRDRLRALKDVADGEANTMPAIVDAVRAEATVGEISRTLEASFGRHQPASVI